MKGIDATFSFFVILTMLIRSVSGFDIVGNRRVIIKMSTGFDRSLPLGQKTVNLTHSKQQLSLQIEQKPFAIEFSLPRFDLECRKNDRADFIARNRGPFLAR